MDKADVRTADGTLIPVAENYKAQERRDLRTLNVQALEFIIATGVSRISVLGVRRSLGFLAV